MNHRRFFAIMLLLLHCGGNETVGEFNDISVADVQSPDIQESFDMSGYDEFESMAEELGFDTTDIFTVEILEPDLSERLSPGEVRAGRITKNSDLIGGIASSGKIGDYKIYNSKVAFIIQDAGIRSIYKRYGGMPIDADMIRSEGEEGQSCFGDLFFGYNLRLFAPYKIEVISDGSDGRAIIRAYGNDGDFPWLASFMGDLVPPDPIGLGLVYEYSLGPDDEYLTIDVFMTNANDVPLELNMLATGFIMGDGVNTHFPGPGFEASKHVGSFPWWTATGEKVSYGLMYEEGPINMIMNYSNVAFGTHSGFSLAPHETRALRRWLVVSDKGLWGVEDLFRKIRGEKPGVVIKGRVEGETYGRSVRVHVLDEGHRSVIPVKPDGTFEAVLPEGKYRLMAKADGFDPSKIVELDQSNEVTLNLPPSTFFTYTIRDDKGELIPGRLLFFRQGGANNVLPERFGEERYDYGAALIVHSGDGGGDGVIPNGTYDIWVSRGFEYETDHKTVIAEGTPLKLEFLLVHSVDSSGYVSTDLHIHSLHSPDSAVPEEERIRTALAAGLEVPVMTDHDTIFDLSPAVSSILGADRLVRVVTGSEVTTYVYGHFNAWPLTPRPNEPANGAIEWFGLMPAELFERIRAHEEHPVVIQVNHPRSAAIGGYFTAVGMQLDEETFTGPIPWSDDFDAVEVFNGGCRNGSGEEVSDFFELLNRGYRVSVSGGSDTHTAGSIGRPRVFVPVTSGPTDLDVSEFVAAFVEQRVFVSCGPFVRFEIEGRGLGETVTWNGPLQVYVQVQAPSWMALKDLRVIRNGIVVFELGVSDWPPPDGAIRFDDMVTLPAPESDSWYVLEVRGAKSVWPLDFETPYALTNPIYVDVDGNGVFDAPKSKWLSAY